MKSMPNSVAWRCLTRHLSIIRRIVRIWEFMDRFLWTPFWFFWKYFSSSVFEYDCEAKGIINFYSYNRKSNALVMVWYLFLWKKRIQLFIHFFYWLLFIHNVPSLKNYFVEIFWSSKIRRGISWTPTAFLLFKFFFPVISQVFIL